MSLWFVSIGYLTAIASQPSYFLPILLLILKEYLLVFEILTDLDDDIVWVVDLTADVERFQSVGDVPHCVFLSGTVLDRNAGLFVVVIDRQKMDASFWEFIEDWRRCPVALGQILELWVVLLWDQFYRIRVNLELNPIVIHIITWIFVFLVLPWSTSTVSARYPNEPLPALHFSAPKRRKDNQCIFPAHRQSVQVWRSCKSPFCQSDHIRSRYHWAAWPIDWL